MEYCASVWDPHLKADIDTLEQVNRRAARVVHNKGWREQGVSPTAILNDLGWETLAERREKQRLIMFFRISHGPSDLYSTSKSKNHSRTFSKIQPHLNIT